MSNPKSLVSRAAMVALGCVALLAAPAQATVSNEPGVLEPVLSHLNETEVRIPNTDQSIDGIEQSLIEGDVIINAALGSTSLLGHTINHVASPNEDMRLALQDMANAAAARDTVAMEAAATELRSILLGTTQGRIYDGYGMLNFNRWQLDELTADHFPADAVEGEYKMKVARDTGRTYISPYDGEERKIWEIDVNMLYYDGQIDSDTFLLKFPFGHHDDDLIHVNYRIYSLVVEDFSPTLVMLDKRFAADTVNFPFKGFDAVWVAMNPGQVIDMTLTYPTVRQMRGVYTWGWREHPPRIQFMQPVYEIENKHTGEIELDPQGESYVYRNREDLSLDNISDMSPEKKMLGVADAVLAGASPVSVERWLTDPDVFPLGTWVTWADLVANQTQIPPEAWDVLEAETGLTPGTYGDYNMISVFMNNEMYGQGPSFNEVATWLPDEVFRVALVNLDHHTHYFRNVDFSDRLHDDIERCCGGGDTSFEVMNFKPSYGAPKVAEMQWRAGWGFRPHHDVIQQQDVFPRGRDRTRLTPYQGGFGDWYYGYQYSAEMRGGDFRFSPPPFIITDHESPAPFPLMDVDGEAGLVIGQFTEGYGLKQMCPQDPSGDFCQSDFGPFNPHGKLNWPSPNDPSIEKTELRFPAFLRTPAQGDPNAGDIIPPTDVWRPFLWISPYNGTLWNDPADPSQGYWADLTYAHGAPVYAGEVLDATIAMPRGSGQVFYQFDDLFHDNAIFSPHPVATGEENDQIDTMDKAFARKNGPNLRVVGQVERFDASGQFSPWASIYAGAAGDDGCTGTLLGVAPISPTNGRFRFGEPGSDVAVGDSICVQSIIGGFKQATVE